MPNDFHFSSGVLYQGLEGLAVGLSMIMPPNLNVGFLGVKNRTDVQFF